MFLNIDWTKGDNNAYSERSRHLKNDNAKSLLFLPKYALQFGSVWPETQTVIAITLRSIGIFLVTLLLILNVWYLYDISSDLAQAAVIFTTVNVCAQSLLRFVTLIKYQKEFAEIITTLWKQFWLINVLPENQRQILKKSSKRVFILIVMHAVASVATNTAYSYQPLLTGRQEFTITPKLPDSYYNTSPKFEIATVAICIISYNVVCFPYAAFDTLYCALVYNFSVQFKILRLRLNSLIEEEEEMKSESSEFREEKTKLLIEYIHHHKLLLRTTDKLKKVYQHFLLIQLIQSVVAIAVCTFAGMVIPAVTVQMVIFSTTSILQLFLYCSFGNELKHQSQTVAYAAYRCGWHFLHHKKLSKMLIMLMHKSQLGEELSALGFTSLNYSTFITVLRAAFSYYTILRVMLDKTESRHK